jgi:hypothetical protein
MDKFIGEGSIVTILYVDLDEIVTYKVVSKKKGEKGELPAGSPLGETLIEYGEEDKTITVKPEKEEPVKVKILKIEKPVKRKQRVVEGYIQPATLSEAEKRQEELEKIETILRQRQIKRLIHFTRLENLESILKRGIWTRRYLDEHARFPYIINDKERLDGKTYCTSLSVSLPNYKMLSHLRQQEPNARWVLLLINPQVLCGDERYLYCSKGNAAAWHGGTLFNGADAFERIFEEPNREEGYSILRKELGLNDWEPTNPQAEILLSGKIEAKDIQGIIFENYKDFYYFKKKHGDNRLIEYNVEIDEENEIGNRWFEPRQDYKYWQKREE